MTTINPASTATGASSVSGALDKTEIASNFTMFLQLLTTQLRNQNPLDPLDTCNRTADRRERQLESQRQQAFDGNHYDQGFDRPKRLYGHNCGQSGNAEFHLERSRQ
jgi:Flagellar hook capping protein - N-terminal region